MVTGSERKENTMITNRRATGATRRVIRSLVLALAFAGAPTVAVATAPTATAATCASLTAHWGSLPKSRNHPVAGPLSNVRAGRHTCFDRMVVDFVGRPASYEVRYVSQVSQDGSGFLVPLRGGARLAVFVASPTSSVRLSRGRELVNVAGFRTFRQIAGAGNFEGRSTFGLGVRARLPMRAFNLSGPGTGSRVVIDVAHHW
jgi:hypothetical protein